MRAAVVAAIVPALVSAASATAAFAVTSAAHGSRSRCRPLLAAVALAAILLPSAAQSAAGERDHGFGSQGSVVTDLQGRSRERCLELLVQPDRKLLCVGQSIRSGSENDDVALVRYLPTGRLDRGFGVNGIKLFDSGLGMDEIAASAVLAPDGRIVVAGVADVAGADRQDFFVARFNQDGSIDSSFGPGGFVTADASTKSPDLDWGRAVALQPDGKIVVAGQTSMSGTGDRLAAALLRYDSSGELDQSFGNQGRLLVELGRGESAAGVNSLLIQPDGRIVIGSSFNPAGSVLARFYPDGRPDASFGSDGVARFNVGIVNGEVTAILRQPDGKLVAAGWGLGGHDVTALARFHANGRVDRSFGTNGRVVSKLMDGLPEVGGYAAALQADGKIVVAGGHGGRLLVSRYLKSGRADMSFGGIGFVTALPRGMNHGYASAVRIQADGRIVAAGAASKTAIRDENFALIRFEARTTQATCFAFLAARTTRRGVVVRWRTRSEFRSRLFLLYRQQWGGLKLIGRFPARGGTARGATYAMTDQPAIQSMCCPGYWLVEVKRNGRQLRYGPVAR